MPESKICAACGSSFEAGAWSSTEHCPRCAQAVPNDAGPAEKTEADAEEKAAGNWSIRPPTRAQRRSPTAVVSGKRSAERLTAAGDDDVEDVSVVQEEVPDSEADSIIAANKNAPASKAAFSFGSTTLFRDSFFWLVLAMGVMPLLIGGISDPVYRLTGLLFFFALLWGGVFQGIVVKTSSSLLPPLLAFFFTGAVGLFALYTLYEFLPRSYLRMALSDEPLTLLIGQIFQVGPFEEACKLVPVAVYLVIRRNRASPSEAVLLGVFSGLGFAAFENIQYSQAMIMDSVHDVYGGGSAGGYQAVMAGGGEMYQVIGTMLLRVFSLVFLHAVFSGIAASLLVRGYFMGGGRGAAHCAAAVAVPAVLHGLYNWLGGVNTIPAGFVIAASFFFFCANLEKVKSAVFTREGESGSRAMDEGS